MQIVILAAGKGTRMGKITETIPKPLLKLKNKALLEYKLESLPEKTSEIIIVVRHLGEQVIKYFGNNYNNIPIKYVWQKDNLGTADALLQCRNLLKDNFMVLMSDDIYDKDDLEGLSEISSTNKWAALSYKTKYVPGRTEMVLDKNNRLIDLKIKSTLNSKYSLIYTGACVLNSDIFNKDLVEIHSGEYGLPQTFSQFTKEKEIKVIVAKKW